MNFRGSVGIKILVFVVVFLAKKQGRTGLVGLAFALFCAHLRSSALHLRVSASGLV